MPCQASTWSLQSVSVSLPFALCMGPDCTSMVPQTQMHACVAAPGFLCRSCVNKGFCDSHCYWPYHAKSCHGARSGVTSTLQCQAVKAQAHLRRSCGIHDNGSQHTGDV